MRDARLSRCVLVVAVVVALASSGISVVSAHSGSRAAPVSGGLPGPANASLVAGAPVGVSTLGLGGWKVQSSENATDAGNLVSAPGYSTAGWLSVTPDDGGSPGTEANAILQDVTAAQNPALARRLVQPGCAIARASVAVTGATIDTVNITVTAATYSATTHLVTLTFAAQSVPPKVGALVTVTGMTPGAYNIAGVQVISSSTTTLTYGLAANPGTATGFGTAAVNRATLTFAAQSGASLVGAPIVVAGVTPDGYNGTFTTLASTTTSVSYYIGSNPAAGSGGSVALNLPTDVTAANVYYSNNLELCFGPLRTGEGAIPSTSEFYRPWWFRTDFTADLATDQRARLVINGVVGQADVWVNGVEVATQATVQGAFAAYSFDVTDLLRSGTNSLAIEMFANNGSTMFTTDFVDWSAIPPDNNTGIAFPIQLHVSRALFIENAHVVQNDNTAMTQADLTVLADVTNTTSSPQTGTVSATITPPSGGPIVVSKSVTVPAGTTQNVSFAPSDYSSLSLHHPQVWWPYQMGDQPLYGLTMDVSQGAVVSDAALPQTFGIRTITTYLTPPSTMGQYSLQWGSRVYVVNGIPFEFRGGGWQPDILLRYSSQDTANQVQIMRGMGLNGFRTEGKELPADFYEQMDRAGLVIDSGFTCCNKWQPSSNGSGVTAYEYSVIYQSSYTIGQRLRNHPSVLGYGYSDNQPTRQQEIWSNMGFNAADFQLPILSAAEYKTSGVLGAAGEKEGPYDWVPPSYWYDNVHASTGDSSLTNNGGAWAWDSETGPGDTVPTQDSLNRFLSPGDQAILWQYPGSHQFHTNAESATANCPPASSTLTLGVSAATWASGTATVTFLPTVPTAPMVGSIVTIAGVGPAGYDGTFTITASSTTSVTYALAANPGTYVSGGTVTIPSGWSTTCNGSHSGYNFGTLANLNISIARRYGNWTSQAQYVNLAQISNYENFRSMFEAYLAHWSDPVSPSTGLNVWMLNKGWPSFLWNIYNYDYDLAGSFYGSQKAQEDLHVLFAYDTNTVTVDNLTGMAQTGLSVESRVVDLTGAVLNSQTMSGLSLATQAVQTSVLKPNVPATTAPPVAAQTYFVELVLKQNGKVVDRNVYWLSTQQDIVNWSSTLGNPQATMTQYGNLQGLQSLPASSVQVAAATTSGGGTSTTTVRITNPTANPTVAFFVRADVRRGTAGGAELPGDNQVLPITWSDNDITLWPGQSQTLVATYRTSLLGGASPVVSIMGSNVPGFDIVASATALPAMPAGVLNYGMANGTALVTGSATPNTGSGAGTGRLGYAPPATDRLTVTAVANKPAFAQGDAAAAGDQYTLTVTNPTANPTSSTVTVTNSLGSGLSLSGSYAGTGWSCTGSSCTRSDALAPGASYPPIAFTVTISATAGYGTHSNNAGLEVTEGALVSGGFGAPSLTYSTATPTPIVGMPNLSAFNYVASAFAVGDVGDAYQITVHNQGAAATVSNVAMTGASWTSGVATVTFAPMVSAPATGAIISVSGVDPAGYNGTFIVTAATASSVSYALAVDPGTYNAGGMLTMPIVAAVTALPATLSATAIYGGGWTCAGAVSVTGITYGTTSRTVSGATWASTSGGRATVNFAAVQAAPPAGSSVTVAGISPSGYNGTFAVVSSTTTSVTYALTTNPGTFTSGGTVAFPTATLTFAAQSIAPPVGAFTVSGVTPSGYNGTFPVTIATTTSLSYYLASDPGAYVGGGSALFPWCSRTDILPGENGEAPPITLLVNVSPTATPGSAGNETVAVSGGFARATASVSSATTIVAAPAAPVVPPTVSPSPILTVASSHSGSFAQGASGAYSLVVSNDAAGAPTAGAVTVIDTLPRGLSAARMTGNGWTCTLLPVVVTPQSPNLFAPVNSCTRSDSLAPGASYPPITLSVVVADDARPSLTNAAAVFGGGMASPTSSTDPTTIDQRPDLTVIATASGGGVPYAPFAQGDGAGQNDTYSIAVANVGFAPTSGTVTMALRLPYGLTPISMAGTGWTCTLATTTCTTAGPLAAGGQSFITLQVGVTIDAPPDFLTSMRVSGGGEIEAGNDIYVDPTFVRAVYDPTTTVVSADFDPTQFGHPVTFTAVVTAVAPAPSIPTGLVQWYLDGVAVGTPVALVGGQSTWTPAGSLAVGTHIVSADYAGGGIFLASSGAPINHTVKKRLATTTAVTSDIYPSIYGGSVTYTATITPENLSSGLPITGHVQFMVDGVATGGPRLVTSGQASIAFSDLKAGNRGIRAQYLADANYTGSTSPTYTQQVKKATPTGSVTSLPPSPISFGVKPAFTATFVNPVAPVGSLAPATVQFLIDGTNMGAPVAISATPTGGTATFTPTWNLPAGTHTIKAKYLGNGDFLAVLSAGYTLKINP